MNFENFGLFANTGLFVYLHFLHGNYKMIFGHVRCVSNQVHAWLRIVNINLRINKILYERHICLRFLNVVI